jgi:hypothetical protein
VDILFKDDVTVILLLDVSFMETPLYYLTNPFPGAAAGAWLVVTY